VAKILAKVADDGLSAFLLTAAGGEGKSTILMQLAIELAGQGYNTFHCTEPEDRETLTWFRKLARKGKIAVLIDNADLLHNVPQIIRQVQNYRYAATCFVLAARSNEWRNVYSTNPQELQLFSIGRLTRDEIRDIAQKLVNCQLATDVAVMTEQLMAKNNQFLLAAMLMATHGESLQNILASVINNIAQWSDHEELLEALGCVVALEARKNKTGQHYFCSQRLFQEFMGGVSKTEMQRLCNRLVGEVSLQPHGKYRIETRHPVIAETLFNILFAKNNSLLNEIEIHQRILLVAGRFSREEVNPGERKLLTVLPLIYAKSDYDKARALFMAATEAEPNDAPNWQSWAILEEKQGNLGAVDQQYTARWLFNQGTKADSTHAPVWQAWALLEEKQGNIGAVDQQYTARWLFNQGTKADSKHAPVWQAWALLEEKQGNIGAVDQQYTARWLFNQGTKADSTNAPTWQAWALLEEKQGNLDKAKQIAQQGLQYCPNAPDILRAVRKIENHVAPENDITTLINQGKCDQAAQRIQQALFKNPQDNNALKLRQLWEEKCGKLHE